MARQPRLVFGHPRFILALLAGAALATVYEVYSLSSAAAPEYHRKLLAYTVSGGAAYMVAAGKLITYVVAAVGLWRMRAWARYLAMGYLGYELVAYVLAGADGLGELLGLQILFLPYATFCFMYLQRNAEAFDRD